MPEFDLHVLQEPDADIASYEQALRAAGAPARLVSLRSKAELAAAVRRGSVRALVAPARIWQRDALDVLAPLLTTTLGMVVVGTDDDPRTPQQWLGAGLLDVVPADQPWRLAPALHHLCAVVGHVRADARRGSRQALAQVVQRLSMVRSMEEIMAIVRQAARQLTGADGACFVLRDGDLCHYADEDAISPLWKGQRFPMGQCISGYAMLHRQPVVIEDIYKDPRIPVEAYQPTFVRSLLMMPIRTTDPIGAIGTYWAQHRRPSADEVELLSALSDTTSVAIANVQLHNELEKRVRDRTQELQQVNEELEAYAASVSHDLRNPLNAIEGFSALLELRGAQQLDETGRQQLRQIREASGRMAHIISDLLSLARVNRQALDLRPVDVGELVRRIGAELARRYAPLHFDLQADAGLIVRADPGLLSIALDNLLSNAFKYSSKVAQPAIAVQRVPSRGGPGMLTLVVRDNGAGFDPAVAGRLFQPFHRLHDPADFDGTGIGLTTVRKVAERHGGSVTAHSVPQQGASFYLTLPDPDHQE